MTSFDKEDAFLMTKTMRYKCLNLTQPIKTPYFLPLQPYEAWGPRWLLDVNCVFISTYC